MLLNWTIGQSVHFQLTAFPRMCMSNLRAKGLSHRRLVGSSEGCSGRAAEGGRGPCLSQGGEHDQTMEAYARVGGNSLKLQRGHGACCSKSEHPLKGGLEVRLCFCNHISFLLRGKLPPYSVIPNKALYNWLGQKHVVFRKEMFTLTSFDVPHLADFHCSSAEVPFSSLVQYSSKD